MAKQQDLRRTTKAEISALISKTQESFKGIKQIWSKDIEDMEKTIKIVRRRRRRLKAKHIAKLKKEELDLEDIMSSSSESPEKSRQSEGERPEERLNFPKLVLENVPILEGGEPLGCTATEECPSEFGAPNSLESEGFLNYAHNHEAYKKASDTTERNVHFAITRSS